MNKKQNTTIIIVVISVLLVIALCVFAYFIIQRNKPVEKTEEVNKVVATPTPTPEDNAKTWRGNNRPIAVMIDNQSGARPQAGLNNAELVYEIIVEGGLTRYMAVFKNASLDQIGPIRSARHYFLDYALENDAIYVHYGWSPQAESDIKTLKVNNINGLTEATSTRKGESPFWRISEKEAPHNVMSSTSEMKRIAQTDNYSLESDKKSVLNYTSKTVNLMDDPTAKDCEKVTIPFSEYTTTSFEYDSITKRYTKFEDGKKLIDFNTKDDLTTKNIIVVKVKNTDLNDGSGKGRQEIDNIGTLEGWYITNGKAIEITASKASRTDQTVYKNSKGQEIKVNDGNTFIIMCPTTSDVTIEGESSNTAAANALSTVDNSGN